LRLPFQLEAHFSLQHVAGDRSAVAVRRGARVAWWELDEGGHHVSSFWDRGHHLLQGGDRRLPGVGSWPVAGVEHGVVSSEGSDHGQWSKRLASPPNVLHVLLPCRTMIAVVVTTASLLVSERLARVPLLSRRQLKTTNPLHRLQRSCQSLTL